MRGQSSIEAMMVVVAFFAVMAIFVGIYMRFSEEEARLGSGKKAEMDLHRIANAVNDVYVMGPGNRVVLDIGSNYTLASDGDVLRMRVGETEVEKAVFTNVEIEGIGERIVVENDGKIRIRSE